MGKHAQPRTGHVCWQSASRRADSGVHHILQRVLPRLLSFPVGGVHAAYPAIIKKVAASMQPQTVAKKELAAVSPFPPGPAAVALFGSAQGAQRARMRACVHVIIHPRACTRAHVPARVRAYLSGCMRKRCWLLLPMNAAAAFAVVCWRLLAAWLLAAGAC